MKNESTTLPQALFAGFEPVVKDQLRLMMSHVSLMDILDMNWLQSFVRQCCVWFARIVCASWVLSVESIAKELALVCPKCGRSRKCKTRPNAKMTVRLLGFDIEVPELYFECGETD